MTLSKFLCSTCALLFLTAQANAATLGIWFTFDEYPGDISWAVKDDLGSTVDSESGYGGALANMELKEEVSLTPGEYTFEIEDSYGDGLCCNEGNGSYYLTLDDLVFYTSAGQFGTGESVEFEVAPSLVPLPAGLPLLLGALGLMGLSARKRRQATLN